MENVDSANPANLRCEQCGGTDATLDSVESKETSGGINIALDPETVAEAMKHFWGKT
ncbi:hypothetical protein KGQ34_03425 [Patescibacteria group bacterium]|nr:hypothetical protein [Patescibacteria group bacterium]